MTMPGADTAGNGALYKTCSHCGSAVPLGVLWRWDAQTSLCHDCYEEAVDRAWERELDQIRRICQRCRRMQASQDELTADHWIIHHSYADKLLCDPCRDDVMRGAIHPCSGCGVPTLQSRLCVDCCKSRPTYEAARVRQQCRRALQYALPATLTTEQWLRTLDVSGWLCAYCGRVPVELLEHYVPLEHGGGTTADNCVPACSTCNGRKGGSNPTDLDARLWGELMPPGAYDRVHAVLAIHAVEPSKDA
jgi:5-methylcytosine-specific restriction endonuclease McrA